VSEKSTYEARMNFQKRFIYALTGSVFSPDDFYLTNVLRIDVVECEEPEVLEIRHENEMYTLGLV
jgi:hypothetical protein